MTKHEWKRLMLLKADQKTCLCYLCGKLIAKKELSLDHVTPLSRGGADDESNWKETHKACNSAKGALTYEEYVQWLMLERKRHGRIR